MNYISVRFENSERTYTYISQMFVSRGDEVIVLTKNGMAIVIVVEVGVLKPGFECKEIVGRLIRPPQS